MLGRRFYSVHRADTGRTVAYTFTIADACDVARGLSLLSPGTLFAVWRPGTDVSQAGVWVRYRDGRRMPQAALPASP
jgi:hypothetical protein